MKKLFLVVLFVFLLFAGQVFAQQDFIKTFPRPAWCRGSGAIIVDETEEVLIRVDEPVAIMTQSLTLQARFRQINDVFYLVADNVLYKVKELSLRWQKVANVDERFLKGEDFSWTHYGHWLYKRPLKYFFK